MPKISLLSLLALLFLGLNQQGLIARSQGPHPDVSIHADDYFDAKDKSKGLLRHIVLFKFKEETTTTKVEEIEAAFGALKHKIPQIRAYEWGLNNSPEGLNKDLTHCFLVTFASEEDRAIYLPHPDHQAFVQLITPWVEDVLVVDYWAK